MPPSPSTNQTKGFPLVSCVMPTRNRRSFALRSIHYFLRQDYPVSELIVVDDGFSSLSAELPCRDSVRYLRVPPGMTLGEKRNFGCQQARGFILSQWDDDDWYGCGRLREQLRPLLVGEAEITVLDAAPVFDSDTGRYWRSNEELHRALFLSDINPRTLMFGRRIWEEAGGYPKLDLHEDSQFLSKALNNGGRLKKVFNRGLFIYVRHPDTTHRFVCGQPVAGQDWEIAPSPELPPEDEIFYAEIRARRPHSSLRLPLVSCVMPTADRRPFVPHAIRHFLGQDYPERELIILDDGLDTIQDLVPEDARIKYVHLDGRSSVGMKRNLGCQHAEGELIAHWDDDDWIAPWRLSYQVGELMKSDADICGLANVYFWEPTRDHLWEYAYPPDETPWVAGGTMLYRRSFWRRCPFADISVGEDNLFVWGQPLEKVLRLEDCKYYVATMHAQNTSPKWVTSDRWYPRSRDQTSAIMGAEKEIYSRLFRHPEPPAQPYVSIRASGTPLVSCVVATRGRPRFLKQAIRCFLRQTLRNAELIVVDDSRRGVEELCSGLPSVRYVAAREGTSLGCKLNLGIEHARGQIVQKLDDDDYYHSTFLECSVAALQGTEPGRSVAAWDCFLVLLAGDGQVRFSGHGWAAGGTLCFHRDLWERSHFRDMPHAVDVAFLADTQAEIRRICAPSLYLVVRHGRNTWVRMGHSESVDDFFRHAPSSGMALSDIVQPIDLPFYAALSQGDVIFE